MFSEIESMLTPMYRINKDMTQMLRSTASDIGKEEARFMVDIYYTMQKERIEANNRIKALDRDAEREDRAAEPHLALDWVLKQQETLEDQIKKVMAIYVGAHPMAWFFEQTVGIGPVLAAGLLAHIDIERAKTAGAIWRFAGLDPTSEWKKGEKRPHNGKLKTLCWKIGESFVKVSNRPDAVYGRIYRERKDYEWMRNLRGELAEHAATELTRKKIGKATDAYAWYSGQCSSSLAADLLESGKTPTASACRDNEGTPMLPPAQVQARAKRYAVKLFLAHLYQRWREQEGLPVASPYAIAHQGHAHWIEPPQQAVARKTDG